MSSYSSREARNGKEPRTALCLLSEMSSGFVSSGTNDKPLQRDDEWLKAQQEIEANRRRKQEEGQQDGGKSLYEVLQQNKGDFL